jgi:hypothetical protein
VTGFYNRDGVCLLRGTDWIFVYNSGSVFCVDLRTDMPTARTRQSGMPQFDVSVDVPVCLDYVRACVLLNNVFHLFL